MLLLAMSRPMVLMQLGLVLMSVVHVATGDHMNYMLNSMLNRMLNRVLNSVSSHMLNRAFNCVLKYEGHAVLTSPLTGLGRSDSLSHQEPLAPAGPAPHRRAVPGTWKSWPHPST